MRRQWTINGRFLAQPLTGVQRYALETVRALDGLIAGQAELARGLEVELVLPPDAVHSPALRAIGMRTVGRGGGHAWEQTALPRAVAGGLLSLCNTGPLSVRKLHGLRKYPNLVFKRGYTPDDTLWKWYARIAGGADERYDGSVVLMNEAHKDVMRWNFVNGFVTKLEGPALKASDNAVAVERMEIIHEQLTMELEPAPAPVT